MKNFDNNFIKGYDGYIPLTICWPLIVTSTLWIIIPFYALYLFNLTGKRIFLFLATIVLISLCSSIIYWIDAHNGFRRNFDICMAYVCLFTFTIVAALQVRNNVLWVWILWPLLISCYIGSWKAWYIFGPKSMIWVYYHIMFHIITQIAQIIVLSGLKNNFINI
jgi:hypothetical protein